MSVLSRPACGTFMLILFLMPFAAAADSTVLMALSGGSAWQMNDMRQKNPDWFETIGPDPYVISPGINVPLKSISGFYGRLIIRNSPETIAGQLFYDTATMRYSETRSYRFQLPLTDGGVTEFFLPAAFYGPNAMLPADERLLTIRLDVENCMGCDIQVQSIQIMAESSETLIRLIPEGLVYPVVEKSITPDISQIGPWLVNDMTMNSDGYYTVNGSDPYLMSPCLDAGLTQITGIFFHLGLEGKTRCRLQFFWNTYSQDYDEKRSFWFNAVFENNVSKFFVPLAVLPKDDLLKTVRLDLEACSECRVKILSARLVRNEYQTMKPFIPRQIMYSLGKSVYARGVLKDITMNLFVDTTFWIWYSLLIVSVCWSMYYLRNRFKVEKAAGTK